MSRARRRRLSGKRQCARRDERAGQGDVQELQPQALNPIETRTLACRDIHHLASALEAIGFAVAVSGEGELYDLALLDGHLATHQGASGGNHLNTLRLAGGITGSGTAPVTDPDTTPQIADIKISATLGTGKLSGISGVPPLNPPATLGIRGFTRVCLFAGCDITGFLPLNNTTNGGATGIGIGGLLTMGKFGEIRISIVNGPWTVGSVAGINQTIHGGFITLSKTGFVHGAASANSSTAEPSGLVQLIAPQQVTTSGVPANSTQLTLFATLTLHFIPEPGLLLLIGSGVVGLGLLGRSRMLK